LNTEINPVLAAGGEPVKYTFSTEEAIPVKVGCNIHPWMGGYVVARKDPYAAVTDKDGNFTIKDLPAGKPLEFRLWQESAGYLKNATFKGGKTDSRGSFKVTIKPGENNLGDIKVPSSIFKKSRQAAGGHGRGRLWGVNVSMRNVSTRNCAAYLATAGICALGLASLSGCGKPLSASPTPQTQVALEIRQKLAEQGDAGQEAAEAEATGTGWGTLRGQFKFVGTPTAPGKLNVTKDTEVCGAGGGLTDNSLLVGPDGGVANVVVYARAKRVHDSAKPLEKENEAAPLVFDQKQCMFLTHVLACQVNQKIDVKNSDPVGHNTKIDPRNGVAFNQTLSTNQTLGYTPTSEEAVPASVSCSIHPWMQAYMLPRKDKYFAVTTSDGSFEIPNLPAGEELELQVWHERGTGPGGALVLPRKDLKWSKQGRFKVKLEPDQTQELVLEVPATALR
jgi:hypothetical protein